MNTNDRTAELFDWLKLTPETQPWAYWVIDNQYPSHEPYFLLTNTLEADGLAVRLVEIASDKVNNLTLTPCKDGDWCVNWGDDIDPDRTIYNEILTHAVHDALCAAMDAERESNATNQ
jgi:hypothetical protein